MSWKPEDPARSVDQQKVGVGGVPCHCLIWACWPYSTMVSHSDDWAQAMTREPTGVPDGVFCVEGLKRSAGGIHLEFGAG